MITFDTIEKEKSKAEPESTAILFSEIMGVQNEFQNSPDIFSPTQGIMDEDEKEDMLKDMDTDFAEKNQKQEEAK